jgi:hypothetical protein
MARKTLVGEVTLEDLLDRLYFPEEEIQQAVLEQAKLFLAAADYRVKKMTARQSAAYALERLRAGYSLQVRKKFQAANAGGKRNVTEGYIKDTLERVEAINSAQEVLGQAESLEEWSKLVLEAYKQRRDVLKILAQFAFVEDNLRLGHRDLDKLKQKRDTLKSAMRDSDNVEELE